MKLKLNINADVGEGLGNEPMLMPYLNSCNVACGGHAGDEAEMQQVVALAKEHGVAIGAHPSYPDRDNFGRVSMGISCADLFTSLIKQQRALVSVVRSHSLNLHHLKPHGALYNDAAKDEKIAKVVIEVVKGFSTPISLYVPYGSVIAKLAKSAGVKICYEAFADRTYQNDLSLTPRNQDGSLITDPEKVWNQLCQMAVNGMVSTIEGEKRHIEADTFCIHGDTPNAVEILKFIREKSS